MEHSERRVPHEDHAAMADAICRAMAAQTRPGAALGECAAAVASIGFSGFSYLVVRSAPVGAELVHHWTSSGPKWKALYRSQALHLADPRILRTQGRSVPVAWDLAPTSADPRAKTFAHSAGAHGLGSGVAWSVREEHGQRAIVSWDNPRDPQGVERDAASRCDFATLALLAAFVHERMTGRGPLRRRRLVGPCLTPREIECLNLAARGMTSADIAVKVGIAERTANFHIGNIIAKLGALNRGEAIARGMALDLVRL